MKPFWTLCAMVLLTGAGSLAQSTGSRLGEHSPNTAPEPTGEYLAIYQDAVRLFNEGKVAEASGQIGVVLGKYPHYKPAVNLQQRIALTQRNDPSAELRRRLDRIVVPRVNFHEARVENAFDFFRDTTRRLDPEKKGVSVVLNVPEAVKQRTITLDLVDVTAGELLRYITEVAGLKYRLDRSVVMITADELPAPAPASPPTTP